jgi:nucleoside-diphosphate-sugar epimerase
VVEIVADLIGRPDLVRFGVRPMAPDEPSELVADVGLLRDEIGWKPRLGLRQGLADAVAWWRNRNATCH